ncbi:MAG TPA: hypothetical protein VKD24_03605 [Candidatus Angelobacter sp.]|nr:hypothetical protein [Candidatus Angelobacter sp.]
MKTAKKLVVLLLVVSAVASARKRDPLTEAEEDQIRNVAQEPYKRLKLYIKFTQSRLDSIDQLRADPKQMDGRGQKIHDLLEDFAALLDEINSNLDQYEGRPMTKDDRKDFHKGLKETVDACDKWESLLKSLKSAMETDPQTRKESEDYKFVFQDAEDSLKSTADMAREYVEVQPAADKPSKKK